MMQMMFFRFFKAWVFSTWAGWRGFRTLAPPEVAEGRARLCNSCDFFNDGICQRCGCLTFTKTMVATEKCPVNRWGRVWIRRKDPTKRWN
jgi:hypothetical protein